MLGRRHCPELPGLARPSPVSCERKERSIFPESGVGPGHISNTLADHERKFFSRKFSPDQVYSKIYVTITRLGM